MIRLVVFLVLCALFTRVSVIAVEPLGHRLTAIADQHAAAGFSGAVLVASGDTVLHLGGYGFANAATREPNTPGTIFRIGSLTKPFTAALILRLGLPLHEPIPLTLPAAWGAPTPHALLSHAAALPEFTTGADFPAAWPPPITVEKLTAHLPAPARAPSSTNAPAYANTHYVLLAALVRPNYPDALRTHILEPAGLKHTAPAAPRPPRGHALGYTSDLTRWDLAGEISPALLTGAGDLVSTVRDLHRFSRALDDPGRLLPASALTAMFTAQAGTFGYGWLLKPALGRPLQSHAGRLRGFASLILRFPGQSPLCVVVLSNREMYPVFNYGLELAVAVFR